MNTKKTVNKIMALVLSAAMVITGMNLTPLGVKAAWYDPDGDGEEPGVGVGLMLCGVWEDNGELRHDGEPGKNDEGKYIDEQGNVIPDEEVDYDWHDFDGGRWYPGSRFEFIYRDLEGDSNVSADDISCVYYADEDVIYPYKDVEQEEWPGQREWIDPRFDRCIKEGAQAQEVELVSDDGGETISLFPGKLGWYVFSLNDLSAFDDQFEEKEGSLIREIGDDFWMDTDDVKACVHLVMPSTAYYSSEEIAVDSLYENWCDSELNFKDADAENKDVYIYYEDYLKPFEPGEDEEDENTSLSVEIDGRLYNGSIEEGVEGFCSTEKIDGTEGYFLYKVEFNEDMHTDRFTLRAKLQNMEDKWDRPESGINFTVTPKPYSRLCVSYVDEYDGTPLFTDGGLPGYYEWDDAKDDFATDAGGNRIVKEKELRDREGMDFFGANLWIGYYDADDDIMYTINDPSDLKVTYYKDREAFEKGENGTVLQNALRLSDWNVWLMYVDTLKGEGIYKLSLADNEDLSVVIESGRPGCALFGSMDKVTREGGMNFRNDVNVYKGKAKTLYLNVNMGEDHDGHYTAYELKGAMIWPNNGGEIKEDLEEGALENDYVKIEKTDAPQGDDTYWYKVTFKDFSAQENAPDGYRIEFMVDNGSQEGDHARGINVHFTEPGLVVCEKDRPEDLFRSDNVWFSKPAPLHVQLKLMKEEVGDDGKETLDPIEGDALKAFKLYSRTKNEYVVDEESGKVVGDRPAELEKDELVDEKYAVLSYSEDGTYLDLLFYTQNGSWVLKNKESGGDEFIFGSGLPDIGVYTTGRWIDTVYGLDEVIDNYAGFDTTVKELPGKKTETKDLYVLAFSNPGAWRAYDPAKTNVSADKGNDQTPYIKVDDDVKTGRTYEDSFGNTIDYSAKHFTLTGNATEDFRICYEGERYAKSYQRID
ncbi:MAG: hypothetical protein J5842_04835, partial [Lachnospiraceae bacterium]|nr:hypothetical protein [Lachnospiraceae bacterium]